MLSPAQSRVRQASNLAGNIWCCMMCVCVTVVTESQDVETSAGEPDTATELRPESNTTTHDVSENHDISTGGYHTQLSGVWS